MRSFVMPYWDRSRPSPLPRGKRKQLGASSMAAHVATMFTSSACVRVDVDTHIGRTWRRVRGAGLVSDGRNVEWQGWQGLYLGGGVATEAAG